MSINSKEFQKRQKKYEGVSAEDRLTSMLSEELAKSIDAEIIKKIMSMGNSHEDNIENIIDKLNV